MDESSSDWITIPTACRFLGVGQRAVRTLISQNMLTCRYVPGSYPRVLRAEVEALTRACTSPARSARDDHDPPKTLGKATRRGSERKSRPGGLEGRELRSMLAERKDGHRDSEAGQARFGGLNMPWKQINGKLYYYRHVKEDGKVRSVYVGTGELAEREAESDRRATQTRRVAAAAWRDQREAIDDDDLIRAATFAAVGAVARIVLEAAGFHQHKRGKWRRKRMGSEIARRQAPTMPGTREQCSDAIARAFAGDASALPMLGEIFDADPSRMLAVANVSLAYMIQEGAVSRIAGDCLFTKEALPRQVEAMRQELAGPRPSPIERLLADRAALCWLEAIDWDVRPGRAENLTDAQEEHVDKMRGRAIRRYVSALKALAQVRKIAVVAFQVNIDKQQISLAEGGGSSA